MPSFKLQFPPRVKEMIAPTAFVEDEELQWKIVDDKMMMDYAKLLLVCSIFLIIVVLL
jgi:hypothetical protein